MRKRTTTLAILVLVAPAAWADITGVSGAPTVLINEPYSLTVEGSGSCDVGISWEQGGGVTPYDGTALPATFTNSYSTVGQKLIRVGSNNQGTCSTPGGGLVQHTVTVLDPMNGLCLVADCGEEWVLGPIPGFQSTVPPVITSVLGAIGEPGTSLLVLGQYFHAGQGKVFLFNALGHTIEMDVVEWHPGGIGVEVPADIAKFCTPPFFLYVVTGFGDLSNTRTVGHYTGEPEVMPRSDVQVLQCGNDGNFNNCNGVNPGGDWCSSGSWFLGTPDHDTSVFAFHGNCPWAIGADSGTDEYRATIHKPGWTISHALSDSERLHAFDIAVFPGQGLQPQPGAGVFDFEVFWFAHNAVSYGVDIVVEGPACDTYND